MKFVDYINLMYKDTNFILDENIRFGEIAGCNIQDLFMEHKEILIHLLIFVAYC